MDFPSPSQGRPPPRHPRWGVALGGGGGRAFAHLGVLRALAAAGLEPDVVAGSSMGALMGALYARRADLDEALAATRAYFAPGAAALRNRRERPADARGDRLHQRRGPFPRLRRSLATAAVALATSFRPGLRTFHPLHRAIDRLIPEGTAFADCAKPFACVALDLNAAALAVFASGPLAPALKAGVSVGLVFSPFRHDGCSYVDAAPVSPVPVRACRALGADRVLAVDLCAPVEPEDRFDTGFDVVRRIVALQTRILSDEEIALADLVIRPETGPVFWADLSRVDEMVEAGDRAMTERLPAWRACLEMRD